MCHKLSPSLFLKVFIFFFIISINTGCERKNTNNESVPDNPALDNPVVEMTCEIISPEQGAFFYINDSILFKGTAYCAPVQTISYLWDFGDGSTETGHEAHHQYTKEGTYIVMLTTTGSLSEAATSTVIVTVEKLYSISGTVMNKKGQGVSHALFQLNGNKNVFTETDENGHFAFTDLSKGDYVIKYDDVMYFSSPEEIHLNVKDHDINDLSFTVMDSIVLYDVDFSGPLHTVGEKPVTGMDAYPRKSPSIIKFGKPHVEEKLYALDQQPCVFGGYSMDWPSYDQIEFSVNKNYNIYSRFSKYSLKMDLLIQQLKSFDEHESFTILIDTPSSQRIDFCPNGIIKYSSKKYLGTIGRYQYKKIIKVKIDFDINTGTIDVNINGQHLYSSVSEELNFSSVRLNMYSSARESIAAVDNIKICDMTNKKAINYFVYDGFNFDAVNYPESDSTTCRGLNDHGDVVGYYWLDGKKYNFFKDKEGYHTVNLNNLLNPELIGINNDRTIIGSYDVQKPYGFIIDNQNHISDIPNYYDTLDNLPPGSFVGGLNNNNRFVITNSYNKISIYQLGSIEISYGKYKSFNCINGINTSNYLVGNQIGCFDYAINQYNSYLYNYDGKYFTTIEYPGAVLTYVTGINDHNKISGFYFINGSSRIFTYNEYGQYYEFPQPDGYNAFSVGINNSGHVLCGLFRISDILYKN